MATVLILMAAVTSGWFVLYLRTEWSDGEVDEEYYLFGLYLMEEVWVTTWDGETDTEIWTEYYGDDGYWDGDEHLRIAEITGYLVWTTVALAMAVLVLTTVQLFVHLGRWDGRARHATLVMAVTSIVLLVAALAYFGAEFPPAVERAMAWWEYGWDARYFGPGYMLAMAACVVFILIALELWREAHVAASEVREPLVGLPPRAPGLGKR